MKETIASLKSDRVFVAFAVAWLSLLIPYTTYLFGGEVSTDYRDGTSFTLAALLVSLACCFGLGAGGDLEQRRLRALIGAAFALWAVEELVETHLWDETPDALYALVEGLFLLFYVLLGAAAFGGREAGEVPAFRILRWLGRVETGLFAVGMYLYFVVVPARSDPVSYGSELPSSFFYVTLDLLLVGLFGWRLARARGAVELAQWRLLGAAAALFALTDTLYVASITYRFDIGSKPWLDPLWLLPHLAVVAAVRIPFARPSEVERPSTAAQGDGQQPRFAPGFVYAATVPAIHLTSELFGAVSPATVGVQRVFVLLLIAVLLPIAIFHQGQIVRLHSALRAEVREARQRLEAATRLDAIGRLAAGVAHDFNNLLTVVLGRADLLLGRSESAAARRDLETIIRAASRAAELTSELLAVGQRGMGIRRRIDANEIVRTTLSELTGILGTAIELGCELHGGELALEIDPSHLERVLRNLAANARDAMPVGGRVELGSARRRFEAAEPIGSDELPAGDYAAITFRDTGCGMDESTLRHLFEPFFTTKPFGRGTGLGLATAYGLVRQNGGAILVSSQPGAGAQFEILLPLAR